MKRVIGLAFSLALIACGSAQPAGSRNAGIDQDHPRDHVAGRLCYQMMQRGQECQGTVTGTVRMHVVGGIRLPDSQGQGSSSSTPAKMRFAAVKVLDAGTGQFEFVKWIQSDQAGHYEAKLAPGHYAFVEEQRVTNPSQTGAVAIYKPAFSTGFDIAPLSTETVDVEFVGYAP